MGENKRSKERKGERRKKWGMEENKKVIGEGKKWRRKGRGGRREKRENFISNVTCLRIKTQPNCSSIIVYNTWHCLDTSL